MARGQPGCSTCVDVVLFNSSIARLSEFTIACYLKKGFELGSPEYFNSDQAIWPEEMIV